MKGALVLDKIIEKKLLVIIKTVLSDPKKEFYLQEISEKSKVPIATTFRMLSKLVDLKILKEKKISRFTIYQLTETDEIDFLRKIFKTEIDPLNEFINDIRSKFEVYRVFIQGEKSKNSANILILSYDIDNTYLTGLAKEMKVKYDYSINFMIVTPEQFEQMEKMGLSSHKKEIYRKR